MTTPLNSPEARAKVTSAHIVDAFGYALEVAPVGVGLAMPASSLPYDMGIIKEALAYEAARAGDQERIAFLRAGFLELAAFVEDWTPSALVSSSEHLLRTHSEVATFFHDNKQELSRSGQMSERIRKKRELLGEEWHLRLRLQTVAAADRIDP